MHRNSWRINRIGTTNVFTASRHTIIPPRLAGVYPPLLFPLFVFTLARDLQTL